MRESKAGEALGPNEGRVGRFAYDQGAFARAEVFFRGAAGEAEVLGLDEIGALELARGEGLRPCLDLAMAALAGGGAAVGPTDGDAGESLRRGRRQRRRRRRCLLVCAARDTNVAALRELAEARGLGVALFEPAELASALEVARRFLSSGR
jgi:hypothetical protein